MKHFYTILFVLALTLNASAQSWVQDANTIEGTTKFGKLGWSTKISKDGTTVITGALNLNNGDKTYVGGARVFSKINGQWTQIGQTLLGDEAYDKYGYDVAISGNGQVIAVSSLFASSSTTDSTGAVKVFKYKDGIWEQIGTTIYGDSKNDSLGWSIDLNFGGSVLAVSAPMVDATNAENIGIVKLFKVSDSLTQIGEELIGTNANDNFGSSVSLNDAGNIIAIGIRRYGTYDKGATKVYQLGTNDSWKQLGNTLEGTGVSDHFGWALDLDCNGTLLIVGSTENDNAGVNAGEVKIFEYDIINHVWNQVGDAIQGDAPGDMFGISVAISSTDTTIVVGSKYNSDITRENGKAKIFKYNNGWNQVGQDIDGRNRIDWFGQSVDISGDASLVTVGAPKYDTHETDEGAAFVYYFTSNATITTNPISQYNMCVEDTLQYSINSVNTDTYKWIFSTDGEIWKDVIENKNYIGVSTDTLTVVTNLNDNGILLRCVVANSFSSDTSDVCTFILDTESPDLDCISDTTININTEYYTIVGTKFDPIVTDNCTIDYLTNNYSNNYTLDSEILYPGEHYINWTAYDMLGNTGTCSEHIVIVSTPTKIKDLKYVDTYLYPSIVKNIAYIKTDKDINNICIYNVAGNLVKIEKDKNIKSINLSDLPSGLYIVTITLNDSTIVSQKIVKK